MPFFLRLPLYQHMPTLYILRVQVLAQTLSDFYNIILIHNYLITSFSNFCWRFLHKFVVWFGVCNKNVFCLIHLQWTSNYGFIILLQSFPRILLFFFFVFKDTGNVQEVFFCKKQGCGSVCFGSDPVGTSRFKTFNFYLVLSKL